MGDYCIGLTEPRLHALCSEVQAVLPLDQVDVGASSVAYTNGPTRSVAKAGDGVASASELFSALLSRPALHRAYQRFAVAPNQSLTSESLPWIPKSKQPFTQQLLHDFDEMVKTYRSTHRKEGRLSEGLLQRIYHFVISNKEANIQHDLKAPELDIEEIAEQKKVRCTGYTKIFLALCSRAGFETSAAWVHKDLYGDVTEHIVAEVTLRGKKFRLDPIYGYWNAPHQEVFPLTLRELLAWDWNNRALDVHDSDPGKALRFLSRALVLDPGNPHFLTNSGAIQVQQGKKAEGRANFLAVLREFPQFHYASFQLGNLEYDAKQNAQAAAYYQDAVRQAPKNEDYLRQLTLALLYSGQRESARRVLGKLLQINPAQGELMARVGSPLDG